MAYETMTLDVENHVARVTLSRPGKFNTMIMAFWQEMVDVFAEIERMPEVRAVVIASTGKHFTAGLDLGDFAGFIGAAQAGDPGRVREQLRLSVLEMQESFSVIEKCRVPVLVASQGGCIGGGVDLISAADMRYCTEDAWFCIQEINIGMTADVGTLQRLPHLIPSGLVRELAYTGRRMPAAEAHAAGLVNAVFPDQETMLAAVLEIAGEIASKAPLAVVGTKEMLNYTRDHPVADALNYMAVWQSGMLLSGDLMEAASANMQKRPPVFDDILPPRKVVRRAP
ncbi:crotonase/enoyl-CoA hydratase family protein [Oceanibacterium hippocampi]|uniref:Carnitinyl-CoA dehydratase n=1 Tax=Oceanibacterium hippocampi TaxID=745714 RepID=A0A1Y5S0G1_9PROT|nr:crotonase/enoyl-CoA hydratase family protein [Oceanibacterium hippocampi]SLN29509.1 Carnitinyl-CoA dehydratase [Oceanibacterium hippocampi]